MELVTIQSIISYFENAVINHVSIAPNLWLDAALKINVLMGTEYDILASLERCCAEIEVGYLKQGMTSAAAKPYVRATNEYELLSKQKARVKQIDEFIKLAKKQATILSESYRNQL